MSNAPKLYLVAGPATLRPQANAAASQWDTVGGHLSFLPPMLCVVGQDPTVATHTAVHCRLEDSVVAALNQMLPAFPGWAMIQCDDPDAALAQAGLARVTPKFP